MRCRAPLRAGGDWPSSAYFHERSRTSVEVRSYRLVLLVGERAAAPLRILVVSGNCLRHSNRAAGASLPLQHATGISSLIVRHPRPNGSTLCAPHCGGDEQHPFHAILHRGKIAVGGNRLPVDLRLDRSRSFEIDVGKSLKKSFRMTGGKPSETFCDIAQVCISTPINAPRRVGILHDQIVRIFLMPLE